MTSERRAATEGRQEPATDRRIAELESTIEEYGQVISAFEKSDEAKQREINELKVLASVGTWHADCRPNRRKAVDEIEKGQRRINELADTIASLRAEIARLKSGAEGRRSDADRAHGWQPIETAPKDQTPILVIHSGRQYVAAWRPTWNCWGVSVREPDCRESAFNDISERRVGDIVVVGGPTHWRPLPAAPPLDTKGDHE